MTVAIINMLIAILDLFCRPLKEPFFLTSVIVVDLLAAGVFGDGFGALADGVLGELAWEKEPDGSLDLPGGEGGASVVVSEAGGFCGDALEDVVDEGVHDGHGFAADAGVGVHLLEHLVDVDGVALPPPLPALLVAAALGFGLGGCLLGSFACCCFRGHDVDVDWSVLSDQLLQAARIVLVM